MDKKYQIFSEFSIKLIAFALMTLDHIGLFLMIYASTGDFTNAMYTTGYVFRCIGRVAFPLFIMMMVEGIRHSKNVWRYILRIGIIALVVMIAEMIIYYNYTTAIEGAYSPLIDLLLCAAVLALLKRKDWYSLFAILPIGFILLTTGVQVFELMTDSTLIWLPFYVRPGYSLLGLVIALCFYYSFNMAKKMIKRYTTNEEQIEQTPEFHGLVNSFQIGSLFVINIVLYLTSLIPINGLLPIDIYNAAIETWCVFAGVFIFLYNGKRGYNKPWFKYGSYLYFPVHIIIIFVIFFLIYK